MTNFNKLRLTIGPNGWGEKRTKTLYQSRFLVNTHQDESLAIEPLRLIVGVCHGLPIISESIARPRPFDGGKIWGATYGDLPKQVRYHVNDYKNDPSKYIDKAKENFTFFKEKLPFLDQVQKAVGELLDG